MKPILLVMAAGMGSRFGGLKQIAPLGPHKEIIMDYTAFDAIRAGCEKIVFIIRRENEALFREVLGDRISSRADVYYAFQEQELPAPYQVPAGRTRPFGTGHAVLSAASYLDAPFMVVNADDYYGREAFSLMATELTTSGESCMVGYDLKNTVTESGTVSRGVCTGDGKGYLASVVEHTKIGHENGQYISHTSAGDVILSGDTIVSMNCWGFQPCVLDSFAQSFEEFLKTGLPANPEKGEFYLPTAAGDAIARSVTKVRLLSTHDRWYGVTYKEDAPGVSQAFASMHAAGLYPEALY